MNIRHLKETGIVDEHQKVVVLEFDGHNESLLYKGLFCDLPSKFDLKEFTISSTGGTRQYRYGADTLSIFIG